jgi:hypothetical protein
MFRKEIKERIAEVFSRSNLTEHAFRVDFAKNGVEKLMKVKYVLREAFHFDVTHVEKGNFLIEYAPGKELLTEETYYVDSVQGVINQLAGWIEAVEAEDGLGSDDEVEVAKLKELFFSHLVQHVKDENRHFTKTEADDLISRLEKLEEQMERVMAGQKKSDAEIKSVKKLVQESKKDVGNMTKKRWLVVGGGKIFNALVSIAKSKEGRIAITDTVKGFLGDGTK